MLRVVRLQYLHGLIIQFVMFLLFQRGKLQRLRQKSWQNREVTVLLLDETEIFLLVEWIRIGC